MPRISTRKKSYNLEGHDEAIWVFRFHIHSPLTHKLTSLT